MKKNHPDKRGPLELAAPHLQHDKVGWIRKYCGKGIFREIWKNRFVVLRGDQMFICEKEVKDLSRANEVLDLLDYERCEEIRKNKSRSKKNHSKFRLQRCSSPDNTVPNLLFLAVSPEEKESWIIALNTAVCCAKNRVLDQVVVDQAHLSHITRDRVKISHNRRLPTRGHLLAVASTSSSDGMLTLDLIQEEHVPPEEITTRNYLTPECARSRTDRSLKGTSHSLPRTQTTLLPGRPLSTAEKNRCASMDQILTRSDTGAKEYGSLVRSPSLTAPPVRRSALVGKLQDLIVQKLQKTEQLLTEVRALAHQTDPLSGQTEPQTEAERLLEEATASWTHAREVLEEVKELRGLFDQLDPQSP